MHIANILTILLYAAVGAGAGLALANWLKLRGDLKLVAVGGVSLLVTFVYGVAVYQTSERASRETRHRYDGTLKSMEPEKVYRLEHLYTSVTNFGSTVVELEENGVYHWFNVPAGLRGGTESLPATGERFRLVKGSSDHDLVVVTMPWPKAIPTGMGWIYRRPHRYIRSKKAIPLRTGALVFERYDRDCCPTRSKVARP